MSKCAGYQGFTPSPCMFVTARTKQNDCCKCCRKLSKLTNHRVHQDLVYRNEVLLQTMLTGSTYPSPQAPRRFSRTLPYRGVIFWGELYILTSKRSLTSIKGVILHLKFSLHFWSYNNSLKITV